MNTSSNAVRGAETASEQLQLELERLRSELDRCATRLQLTEKLLEHVVDAVFVADLHGRIIDVNPYLRLTIDTIPILAWCSRPDGSNEFLNQRWLDYTGLSIEAARGCGG